MPPAWLTALAWASLAAAVASAGLIAADIALRGHRQRMTVMNLVWPITGLYLGPLALAAYGRWGRPAARQDEDDAQGGRDRLVSGAIGVGHCGAGCVVGDVAGAWLVFATGWTLLGIALPAEYVADFSVAFILGIAFQYAAIAPMRGLGFRDGVMAALKADTLSLLAFEVGMFAWMAVVQLVIFTDPHLTPDHAAYWLLMQVGMAAGFVTALPVNIWLIARGIKEAM
ncbi:MAG: DUF4396 domain-containing protein [Thermoleophilia bacterium]